MEKKESVESTAHKEDPYKSLLKVDPSKSIIDTGKSRLDTAKSRIDISKSRIDTTKSRMDPKRSLVGETCKGKIAVRRLKDHKTALKKMDDV
jgi:hypothetical protein